MTKGTTTNLERGAAEVVGIAREVGAVECRGARGRALVKEEKGILFEIEVLKYLSTHIDEISGSARKRDRVYRQALKYKWLERHVSKVVNGGILMIVPRYEDRKT